MLRRSILGIAFVGLISTALVLGVPRPTNISFAGRPAAPAVECDSGNDPCVRVYKTLKDIESQSYSVVKFTEAEIRAALVDDARRIHYKIKDETGFDCKRAEYKYDVFRCEEGALVTHYELLITALQTIY